MEKKFWNSLKWWDMVLAYIPVILVATKLLPMEFLLAAVPPVLHQAAQSIADLGKNKKSVTEEAKIELEEENTTLREMIDEYEEENNDLINIIKQVKAGEPDAKA